MTTTRVAKDSQGCRSTTRRKLLTAGLVAGLVAALSGIPASAGSSTAPDITDVAGDANFINGQGVQPGHEGGPDTRPASFDNVDLRAVWFETAYTTTKVRDAAGNVLRVEHAPTALLVRVQTQGPARPMSPWNQINYEVAATLPGCKASFRVSLYSTTTPPRVTIRSLEGTSCGQEVASPVTPTFEGAVSTMTFPLAHPGVGPYISAGTAIRQPAAVAAGLLPTVGSGGRRTDETVVGRDFTIGQDVPPDIDCSADPTNSKCDS